MSSLTIGYKPARFLEKSSNILVHQPVGHASFNRGRSKSWIIRRAVQQHRYSSFKAEFPFSTCTRLINLANHVFGRLSGGQELPIAPAVMNLGPISGADDQRLRPLDLVDDTDLLFGLAPS
jgi:hypothetical protein